MDAPKGYVQVESSRLIKSLSDWLEQEQKRNLKAWESKVDEQRNKLRKEMKWNPISRIIFGSLKSKEYTEEFISSEECGKLIANYLTGFSISISKCAENCRLQEHALHPHRSSKYKDIYDLLYSAERNTTVLVSVDLFWRIGDLLDKEPT
jgi:hypothetical protein